ncbi:MAG: ATP-binding protein [Patescibacteria group bacterium]|nr:ATP-binding protein [Patescibacteria group bacterium]
MNNEHIVGQKKRLLFYELEKHISHKNALVVTGMRQVGKTTLLRQVYDYLEGKPKVWFDLDNPLDQKLFEDIDYKNIYENIVKMSGAGVGGKTIYVFVDEIQNFPQITKIIKYLLDHFGVKFLVTGSSSFYLKNLFPESLAGRKFLFVLKPLDFWEYLYFKGKISLDAALSKNKDKTFAKGNLFEYKKVEADYEDFLLYGGFPEVVVTKDEETKRQVLKNIFASFFEKDLKILSDYKDTKELRDLILLLVPRVGSLLDVTRIASELGVERVKVYSYLEFLRGIFFLYLAPRFSKSVDRSVAGGRKVYFCDNGLLNIVGKVSEGQILENSIYNQLSKFGEVSYYNKRGVSEIDFILDKQTAFEVKSLAVKKDVTRLKKLALEIGIENSFVISKRFTDIEGILFSQLI